MTLNDKAIDNDNDNNECWGYWHYHPGGVHTKTLPCNARIFKEVLESWRRVSMRLNGKNWQVLTVSCQKS